MNLQWCQRRYVYLGNITKASYHELLTTVFTTLETWNKEQFWVEIEFSFSYFMATDQIVQSYESREKKTFIDIFDLTV